MRLFFFFKLPLCSPSNIHSSGFTFTTDPDDDIFLAWGFWSVRGINKHRSPISKLLDFFRFLLLVLSFNAIEMMPFLISFKFIFRCHLIRDAIPDHCSYPFSALFFFRALISTT